MSYLSETWFIEGNIDFESKKYILLAYLQRINASFVNHKLYPELSDIIFHYKNLKRFKDSKQLLKSQFPKKLSGLQLKQLEVIYEEMIQDDDLMTEIEAIVYYAMQKMQGTVTQGTTFYDEVEKSITITPIGIIPSSSDEGYFLLCDGKTKSIKAYLYRMSIFNHAQDRFRTLRSQFMQEWRRNFVNTYESIKLELLKAKKSVVLPAVYAIETNLDYPTDETLLPVAKRLLVQYISNK